MMDENIDLFDALVNDASVSNKNKIKEIISDLKSEIELIPNKNMQEIVSIILSESDHFWVSPSSNLEDHYPPDEYSYKGMVLHTKRTVRTAFCMINSVPLEEDEMTALLSACLLHCVCKPLLPNDVEISEQIYDHNYMINVDQFIIDAFNKAVAKKTYPVMESDSEIKYQQLLDLTIRLIHCSEGLLSPIPELYPKTQLEMMMAASNMIARSLHMITDGVNINEDRWIVGTELDD